MEPFGQVDEIVGRNGRRRRHADVEVLTGITHLHEVLRGGRRQTGRFEFLLGLTADGGHESSKPIDIDLREWCHVRPDEVDHRVGDEDTEGREGRRGLRDEHSAHAELARHRPRVDGSVAAVRDQGERARIRAVRGQHPAGRVGHVGVHDPFDAPRRFRDIGPERNGDVLFDCGARGVEIELHPSARKGFGREVTEYGVGVGDGGMGAAASVTGGSGIRAR